jgi:MFS family permease
MRPSPAAPGSVWREREFVRLWSAGTISVFGSLITRTALPFAAILVLGAGPVEIAILRSLELIAGIIVGLFAGAWVDRLRRRPIMIATDIGRAVLLGSIPLAALGGVLRIEQLYVVAFLAAILSTFFNVADRAYLPTLVDTERLVDANSALTASASVAEFSAFGISGFLIQIFTAPIAIAVDAVSFVISALLLATIRRPEPPPPPVAEREPVSREIREGLRIVAGSPILRAMAAASASAHVLWGMFSATYLLFASQVVGLSPAAIGVIVGMGGAGSLIGALLAGRTGRRLGVGWALIVGMVGFTIGNAFIPLAPSGAVLVGAACLIAQQVIGDLSATVYEIVQVSVVQSTVEDRLLGRVTGTIRFFEDVFQLGGTVAGGLIAEAFGLRAATIVGLIGGVAAVAFLATPPIRRLRTIPERGAAPLGLPGEDVPRTE